MLSIGKEKYRNLQEQVGFNTEQIKKIFEVLDGLNVQDNVVVVSDISTPLTAEELEIINREVAFIIYNNQLYIKKTQDSSNAYFEIVFSLSVSGSVISLNSNTITVTLSNGALGTATVSTSTYTLSELDTKFSAKADTTYVDAQLALKANLSGATFTGAVVAPTLEQTNANWKADLTQFPSISGGVSSLIFGRLQQINGELHLVLLGKITNNSGSPISAYSTIPIAYTLPYAIASKIYDVDGNNVSISGSFERISANIAFVSKDKGASVSNLYTDVFMIITNHSTPNAIQFTFGRSSQMTINDGETLYFESRVSLDLL